jgi:amino acid adenylation domain-containing protein
VNPARENGSGRDDKDVPSGDAGPAHADVAPTSSEAERYKLLYQWNDTGAEYPDVCAHQLFEQQVERSPDAVAVVFKDRRLTYRELNQRANQVAHFLRKQGVGPDTLVGVSLERTPELVIALLGVWKAGGAYVPLDTAYPQERLSFMVEDAGIRMLVTEEKCRHLFPASQDKTVCLDSDWSVISRESTQNPNVDDGTGAGVLPSNLAYVMYTSGSTGQPKGAMIVHSGLVNYLWWAIKAYAIEAGGSVPVHTSVSFDLTVTSLYPALLAGGQAELIPEDVAAQNLMAALRRGKNRNLVKITPAHLDLLGQQLAPQEVAGMTKMFVIGGENLVAESLQLWREFAPGTRLVNEYGPTETVVGCCVHEVQTDDPRNGSIPIGRPIANTQLYVLDAEMQPVPLGVMGELYIGGAGVARGYHNRPELTRERFLPDPFSRQPEARLYKTGDLARHRADGILEYLGRVDNQVKVRGYRIELGEIEATLAGHPAVQSCAVLAREDSPGNKQLVGYVVARPEKSPTIEDLQGFVKLRLPEYMAPGQFVFLESLPLTNNGKVDRKALPAPVAVTTTAGHLAASTPTEQAIMEIWQRILQRDRVGTRDDFFDVGGHSLLVLAMMSEIKQTLGVDLPLASVLQNTTIESLGVVIDGIRLRQDVVRSASAETVPTANVSSKPAVPNASSDVGTARTSLDVSAPKASSERPAPQPWSGTPAAGPSSERPTPERSSVASTPMPTPDTSRSRPSSETSTSELSPFLTPLRAGGGTRCIFFVYDGDGDVLPYLNIARRMPPEFAVYGISPFGLPGMPLAHLTIPQMARHCVGLIQRRQPHGPYVVGGLCAGGVIAFEAARQLEQSGNTVQLVILLDAIRPSTPARRFRLSKQRWRSFSGLFSGSGGGRPQSSPGADGTNREWRSTLVQAGTKLRNVVEYEATRSVKSAWIAARQRLVEVLLARGKPWPEWIPPLRVRDIYNYRARASFPQGSVSARLALVKAGRGAADSDEPESESVDDPFLGWTTCSSQPLEVIDAPGGHVGMLKEPNVDVLARALARLLKPEHRTEVATTDARSLG